MAKLCTCYSFCCISLPASKYKLTDRIFTKYNSIFIFTLIISFFLILVLAFVSIFKPIDKYIKNKLFHIWKICIKTRGLLNKL